MIDTSLNTDELQRLSQRFTTFAESECHDSSALYECLSHGIAADPEMLALAARCRSGQPAPNLFLAAVHFLLLQGMADPLREFYADLSASPAAPNAAYPAFREFCFAHREQLISIISSRLVQTNEIRRCSYLYPAFALVAKLAEHRPLALIEVGTSAGLNLMWDAYGYRYQYDQEVIEAGDTGSVVQIASSVRGDKRPSLPAALPRVQSRTGIDLNAIDLRDETDAQWLRALIWPEHDERVKLFENARSIVQQAPLRLLSGDAIELLPGILEEIPADAALIVFHTHTVNQFPAVAKEALTGMLKDAGKRRELFRLANDIGGGGSNYLALKLIHYRHGLESEHHLANVDSHGRWFEWLAG